MQIPRKQSCFVDCLHFEVPGDRVIGGSHWVGRAVKLSQGRRVTLLRRAHRVRAAIYKLPTFVQ